MSRRVLVLADNPYMGGITSHVLSIVDAFRNRDDFEIVPATFPALNNPDRTLFDRCAERGVECHEIAMAHRFDWGVRRRLRAFVQDHHVDLIHTHAYRGAIIAAPLQRHVPIVATSHGVVVAPAKRTTVWQRMHMRRLREADAVIAVSNHVQRWLVEQGVPPGRIHIVYNGFAPPQDPGEPVPRRLFAKNERQLIILYVGRLVAGKNVDILIDAMAGMDDMTLVCVGDGPLRETWQRHAAEKNVHAHFAGHQDNPWPYYRITDVIALPSTMEAFPSVLIEAASQGVPAIASNVGGIPEIVIDNETGALVPPGNEDALRDALDRMADESRRIRYGANARFRWQKNFTLDAMAEGLAKVYAVTRLG